MNLPDIQKTKEGFPTLPIEKVGVRNITLPLMINSKDGNVQTVSAKISSYCNLVEDVKGINMSRIGRTLTEYVEENKGLNSLEEVVFRLQESHQTDNVYVKSKFTYLIRDVSPLTKLLSYEPVEIVFENYLKKSELRSFLTVKSVELSLCPCSKEMSLLKNNLTPAEMDIINNISDSNLKDKLYKAGFGAHNQKSEVEVKVEISSSLDTMWIEDIINIIRSSVSSPTYTILKRPDEKWVTEVSYMGGYYDKYNNFIEVGGGPRFVEDIARLIAEKLNTFLDIKIMDYVVVVNNQESIHSSDIEATAVITAGRNLL